MDLLITKYAYAVASGMCFAMSTIAFKYGVDTGDQRFTMGAFATLSVGYVFFLKLMEGALSEAILLSSMLSQVIALIAAFFWFQEPITWNKVSGAILALVAMLIFSLPSNIRS